MKQTVFRVALIVALSSAVGLAEAQRRHPGGGSPPPSAPSGGGGGGGGGGGAAVPRGGGPPPSTAGRGGGGRDDGGSAGPRRNPGGSSSAGASSNDDDRGRAVGRRYPGGAGGGYAVPRGTVRPPWRPGGDQHYWYYPRPYGWYYNPWGWGTFGFGYVWDPFWWGYGGGGYPWGPYGGGYYGGYNYRDPDEGKGGLRLKVKPRQAEVVVDGYFYGVVDDFDGSFQKLKLETGPHKVEVRLNGYEPLAFQVNIVEGETITYKGQLQTK